MSKLFFFIIWSNPWLYLTLIPIAKILAKKNYKIYIFCQKDFLNKTKIKNKNIIFVETNTYKYSLLKKITFIGFVLKVAVYSFLLSPKFVIGFNLHGFLCSLILKKINNRISLLYYNYDFDLYKNIQTTFHKFLYKLNKKYINDCDLIIVPNKGRENLLKKILKTKKQFLIVKNTFSKNFRLSLKKKRRYISHIGFIGSGHYIEELINSASYIKEGYKILLAGICEKDYFEHIKSLIDKKKLNGKVMLKRNISINDWYNYLSSTYIGLVFYEPINVSNLNMNMTSQKMNNFIMAQIPMIVNNNIDFKDKNYLYYSKSKPTPSSISKKINHLINNKLLYDKMSNNLRKLFFNTQNLEFEIRKFLIFLNKKN
ncbi:hypothetical protein OAM12_05135 [Candidatus Pelagibacter sp.]|nr:hypothetical protein [Candidatus Pelagibacter sp.]